ncbi:MAG TPA: hypothetical protein VMU11_03910 [Verrucomicrobiae bacterium]|nr:hypothetical protein [Verrucomicrobiae bacterium]
MANIRLFLSATLAVLSFGLPSLASAQRVHEVRPSPDGEVRIGVDGNGSMDDLVALARRITGNEALTADDVLANNAHVRYVCRSGGRQLSFSRDAAFGGRCPERAERSHDGLVRGTFYRIPRVHGAVLPPRTPALAATPVPRAGPSADAAAARIAELEAELRDLNAANEMAESRVLDALNHADTLSTELERLRSTPAAEPQAHTEFVRDPAQQAELEQLREENARLAATLTATHPGVAWWVIALLSVMLTLAFLYPFYGYVLVPRVEHRLREWGTKGWKQYEVEKKKYEDEHVALRASDQDKFTAEEELKLLRPKLGLYERGRRIWRIWNEVANAQFEKLKEELRTLHRNREETRAAEQTARDERIQRNRRIGELREMSERVEAYRLQIAEATDYLSKALAESDEDTVRHCHSVIAQCERDLKAIPYDVDEVRRELDELVAIQAVALTELCGFDIAHGSTDQWRAETEAQIRRKLMEAEAKRAVYVSLCQAISNERHALAIGNERELAEKKAALDAEYAAKDGALMGKLWSHGLDASTAREDARQIERAAERQRQQLKDATIRAAQLEKQVKEMTQRERVLMNTPEADQTKVELLLEYDAKIHALQEKVRHLGGSWSDPPPPSYAEELPEGDDGSTVPPPPARAVRERRHTGSMLRTSGLDSHPSDPPAPTVRKEGPLLAEVGHFLDLFSRSGNGAASAGKVLHCSEDEARDLLYLLHNFFIESPLLPGRPRLRSFASQISKIAEKKPWLESRRKTIPPPAPALG